LGDSSNLICDIIVEWFDATFAIGEQKEKHNLFVLIRFLWCRLKSGPGGIKSEGSSELTSTGMRVMLTSEQGVSLHREHIAEQRVVAKGSNRFEYILTSPWIFLLTSCFISQFSEILC